MAGKIANRIPLSQGGKAAAGRDTGAPGFRQNRTGMSQMETGTVRLDP